MLTNIIKKLIPLGLALMYSSGCTDTKEVDLSNLERYSNLPNLTISKLETEKVDDLEFSHRVEVVVKNNGFNYADENNLEVEYSNKTEKFTIPILPPQSEHTVEMLVSEEVKDSEIRARVDSENQILEVHEDDNTSCINIDNSGCSPKSETINHEMTDNEIVLPNFTVAGLNVSNVEYDESFTNFTGTLEVSVRNNGFDSTEENLVFIRYSNKEENIPLPAMQPTSSQVISVGLNGLLSQFTDFSAEVDPNNDILEIIENDNSKCVTLNNSSCSINRYFQLPNLTIDSMKFENIRVTEEKAELDYVVEVSNNGLYQTHIPIEVTVSEGVAGGHYCPSNGSGASSGGGSGGGRPSTHQIPILEPSQSSTITGSMEYSNNTPEGCFPHDFEFEITAIVDSANQIIELYENDNRGNIEIEFDAEDLE